MAMVFMLLISYYGIILTRYVVGNLQAGRGATFSDQAGWLAEAGLQKAIWCLAQDSSNAGQCGGAAGGSYVGETFSLNGGSVTVTLAGDAAVKTITSSASFQGVRRKKSIQVSSSGTVSFPFALGIGGTGATSITSTAVDSDIYTSGDLTCSSSKLIHGSVTVAGNHTMTSCKMSGDGAAHAIKSSNIGGDAYYKTIQSTTVAGTLHPNSPDPANAIAPISQGLLDQWKNDAKAGGTASGNVTLSGSIHTYGPKEVTGNLTINSSSMTINGTVYVHGNLVISNNSTVLSPAYGGNDGVIIADGTISISNNANVSGSGSSGSYLILISLSSSASAISLTNNAAGPILYAPNGKVTMNNNATADAVSASSFSGGSNTTINYAVDMQSLHVIPDPYASGLLWSVVPGTRGE